MRVSCLVPFYLVLFFLLVAVVFCFRSGTVLGTTTTRATIAKIRVSEGGVRSTSLSTFFQREADKGLVFLRGVAAEISLSKGGVRMRIFTSGKQVGVRLVRHTAGIGPRRGIE